MKAQTQAQKNTLTNLEIMENAVIEYINEKSVSPFIDISFSDTDTGDTEGQLNIDMDKDFEEKLNEEIVKNGGNLEETLSEYFTKIIKEMMETFSEEDIENLKNIKE